MADVELMRHALELARRGQGYVEPNPMVGAVIVRNGQVLASGWHKRYGGPHAEIEAFREADARQIDVAGADMYVTLEPCCHYGKTPPCSLEIIRRKIGRVIVAMTDPNPQVAGNGLAQIRQAGIEVLSGVCEEDARQLNAPFVKIITTHRPWVMAKYACTLDGKIASRTRDSRWISNECSRAWVHQLRSRLDAIIVGAGTFRSDDPLLTARLPDGQVPSRTALRIVFDLHEPVPETSQLERTAGEFPTMFTFAEGCLANGGLTDVTRKRLDEAGIEVLFCKGQTRGERLRFLLAELGHRWKTNVLVEGGSALMGTFFDERLINEVYAFIAPKICGGADAIGPVAGKGLGTMAEAARIVRPTIQTFGDNVLISGPIEY